MNVQVGLMDRENIAAITLVLRLARKDTTPVRYHPGSENVEQGYRGRESRRTEERETHCRDKRRDSYSTEKRKRECVYIWGFKKKGKESKGGTNFGRSARAIQGLEYILHSASQRNYESGLSHA